MPRKYQHTMELLPQIKEMLSNGMTQKEVEQKLGLAGTRPVHQLLMREQRKEIHGIPKSRKRIAAGFSLAHRKGVKASVKYKVIYRHREKYGISEMCRFFGVSRSGYYTAR